MTQSGQPGLFAAPNSLRTFADRNQKDFLSPSRQQTLYRCCTFDTQKFRQAKASFPQLGRLKKDGNPTSAAGELQGDRNAKIVRWCCLLLRPLV